MDDNKNLDTNLEQVNDIPAEEKEEITTETVADDIHEDSSKKKKKSNPFKRLKLRSGKMKNQALFKRGSYSVVITVLVLAGLIVFNTLVGALAKRFNLEYDMSTSKVNSVSEENIEFIKSVKKDVSIVVCASEDEYAGAIEYYAYYNNQVQDSNGVEYYKQTLNLINKYSDLNSKIDVRFIDTQDTAFTEISKKYPNEKLTYGDIIVSATRKGEKGAETEVYKKISYKDIYTLSDPNGYAAMGYGAYTIGGNNIETALTSAVAYVSSEKTKKLAIINGHSSTDVTANYITTLKNNNYEVTIISDPLVTSISSEYDTIVIAGPTSDFLGSELDAISAFLENDGKLSKGLVFFANASAPYLPNLYDFLAQWGIEIEEGILFETNSSNYMPDTPTTMGMYPAGDNKITSGMEIFITGYNVAMSTGFETQGSIKVTNLISTTETVVNAPVGTANSWTGASEYTKKAYSSAIESVRTDYNDDNEEMSSYVMAFGSTEYINSEWTENSQLANKDISLACAERASGAESNSITFVSKTITSESFSDQVTDASKNTMKIIFMFIIPILTIIVGIVIFIRRKNA